MNSNMCRRHAHPAPVARACGIIICLLSYHSAIAMDAAALMKKSELQSKSHTEKALFKMELIDKNGSTLQTRTLESYYRQDQTSESTLQKFLSPPVVQGTGFLIIDYNAKENDIWNYIPSTRRLRRISGSEKSNWYMGTEFTYEDFEDYNLNAYKFAELEDSKCADNSECFVIEATPATPEEKSASGYQKKLYWLEKVSLYPVKVQYFAKNGTLSKELTTTGLARDGRYWRPKTVSMQNINNGKITRITNIERELDISLSDYYTTTRYLRKD